MKTKFFTLVLCLICFFALASLTSCSYKSGDTVYSNKYANLEVLESDPDDGLGRVLIDRTTGVLYYYYINGNAAGLTPLYNADGSLKNIKDFE